jgi:uncharacterized protein (DUF58 family)
MRLGDLLALRSRAEDLAGNLPALQMAAENAVNSILHGNHKQKRAGTGEKFWQFREYMTGDRPQDIDWRQSAKSDRVFIRQKEWQTAQTCYFWCSNSPSMRYAGKNATTSKGDAARILSLALALLLTKAGEHVAAFGESRAGRSNAALQNLGIALTDSTGKPQALPPSDRVKLSRHAHFILAGDFLQPVDSIIEKLEPLSIQSKNVILLQVLDYDEIFLPFDGRCIFQDMNTNTAQERIENVSAIRKTYMDRIAQHLQGIENYCTKAGWHYVLYRTDQDITQTLNTLWMILSAQAGKEQVS